MNSESKTPKADAREKGGKKAGTFARCMEFAGKRGPLVVASMLLAVLSALASFIPYIAIFLIIQEVIGVFPDVTSIDVDKLNAHAALAVAGAVIDVGCYLAALLCSHAAAFDTQYRIKLNIARHLGRIPLGHIARLGTGRIAKAMDGSVEGVEQFIAHSIPDLAATATAPVALLVLLFVFDWRFGLATITALAIACAILMSGYANKQVMEHMRRYQAVKEQLGNATVEYIRGIRVVKTFGQTASSFGKLADTIKDYTRLMLDVTMHFQNSMPGFSAVINSAYLFVLPLGILLAPGVGDWPSFVMSLIFYLLFVHSISAVFTKIMYVSEDGMITQAHIDRIDAIMEVGALPVAKAPAAPLDASISFENVSFTYEEDGAKAVDGVSFDVLAGTVCAIVGPSGSGKTTLANLVARFWDVDEGRVLIGGTDVRDMNPDELMGQMSLVFQDAHLFRESIADNIRRGCPSATDSEVARAARAAQADDFIRGLPNGYETIVGVDGAHLSGGERQRIAIARAIISDAPIVVLDEATAFSDPENEHLIQKAFESLMAGKTVILIAHRLSTVMGADQIVVMDGGRKVEEGTHAELIGAGGLYMRLWEQYTRVIDWEVPGSHGCGIRLAGERRQPGAIAGCVDGDAGRGGATDGAVPWLQRTFNLSDDGYRGLKGSAAACTISDLVVMIPFTCTVAAFGVLVTSLTGEPLDTGRLWVIFAAGLVGLIGTFAASRNDFRKTYVSAYTVSEGVRIRIADHLRRLPMSFFNRHDVTEVADNIMNDVAAQESMLSSTLPQLIAGIVSTVLVCALLTLFDWRLALATLAPLPIAAIIFTMSRARQGRLFQAQHGARLEALAQVQDYLEGIKDIRACQAVGGESENLERALAQLKRITMQVELAVDISVSLSSALLRSGVGLVACTGAVLLVTGQIDFLTLLMFLLIVSRVYGPILALVSQLPNLLNLSTKTARIKAVMDEPEARGSEQASMSGFDLSFEDVRFGYGDEEVLHGVSFEVKEGEVTALVGPSGSGKSTCAQLIARFWQPDAGRVTCSGADIARYAEESWMSNISMVFQDVLLFNDTVAGNIRIGRLDATDEEIREAAEAAHCLEFIDRLPDGFETVLGENGASLSGGERQRLSIARALLKDAPIVLLDEVTASLDPENETLVQEAIGKLCRGKTVVAIAHRLRTIARADNIIVLDDGRVAEQGTHAELLSQNGLYARLWNLQQDNSGWTVRR